MTKHLNPIAQSPAGRDFLFACAYWILAADGALRGLEQDWLAAQFSTEDAYRRLNRFVQFDGEELFTACDEAAAALSDSDRRAIHPHLRQWLAAGATSDHELNAEEIEAMNALAARINLDEAAVPASAPEAVAVADEPAAEAPPAAPQAVDEPEAVHPSPRRGGEPTVTPLEGHTEEVAAVAIHPEGRLVLSGAHDRTVRLWDLQTTGEVMTLGMHKAPVTSVVWMPDGRRFLSADRSGRVVCTDTDAGQTVWDAHLGRAGGVAAMSVHPDGRVCAVVSPGAMVVLLETANGQARQTWRQRGWCAFRAARFTPAGDRLAVAGDDRLIRFIDPSSGNETGRCAGHRGLVLALAFTADGSCMVTGSRDNTVRIWDTDEYTEIRRYFGHTFSVYGVDVEADARWMISASWDHTARLWDPRSGRALLNYDHSEGRFNAVACVPRASAAVLACSDKNLYHVAFEA